MHLLKVSYSLAAYRYEAPYIYTATIINMYLLIDFAIWMLPT